MEKRRIPPLTAKPVVVSCNMVTPFGVGIEACRNGLYGMNTAIRKFGRFNTTALQSDNAAVIEGLVYHEGESLVMQMIDSLFGILKGPAPEDSALLVATTKGEIDLLEKRILDGNSDELNYNLSGLLTRISNRAGIRDQGSIVSAACASSSCAVARAALMIISGRTDCVLVVACDSVTEFVFAGFSSLMALDKTSARPFDKSRSGLSLGEAAAYTLIMSRERARREGRQIIAEISGWGLSDDANHMTGPSRTSEGMILALHAALSSSGCLSDDIAFISAHGTGTVFNDQMEMRAYRSVFDRPLPVYSVKGAIGHTLGAAGLVELIIAATALQERTAPPTVNLKDVDADALGWASPESQPISSGRTALVTNAGFSGINTALALSRGV